MFTRSAIRIGILLAFATAIAAHLGGYKIYAYEVMYDNRPLPPVGQYLASVAAPNVVITSEGHRFEVRGVTFSHRLLDRSTEELAYQIAMERQVVVQPDSTPSGVSFYRHKVVHCGLSIMPSFFPGRSAAYRVQDLGEYLVARQLASSQ